MTLDIFQHHRFYLYSYVPCFSQRFPDGSAIKNLSAMQERWVQSLGWEDPLQKGMATHSRILAWRISWTEEPGGLQSIGLQRVGHVGSNLAPTHAWSKGGLPSWLRQSSACQYRRTGFDPRVGKILWRRKWQPAPVFLPGESHRQRSLVGYSLWDHKESDMTEQLTCAWACVHTHTHTHTKREQRATALLGCWFQPLVSSSYSITVSFS